MKKLLGIIILFITAHSFAQNVVDISGFGLKVNSRENAVPYILKALDSCRKLANPVLVFPKGRYDFWSDHCIERNYYESNTTYIPQRRLAILIEKFENFTLEGNGSDFIFHGKMQPLTIDQCKNVAVRNIAIDWEIPFGAEATIADVQPTYFDLTIDDRLFPYVVENQKLYFVGEGWKHLWGGVKWNDPMQFDEKTLEVTQETNDDLLGYDWEKKYTAELLENGQVRIHYNNNQLLKKNSILVLRHGVRDHSGVFMAESSNILLEHINMHNNTGMSYLAQYCENITFNDVNCIPSAKRKIISGHDDGLHFSNCKGAISLNNCTIKGLMDDAVNVHGSYVMVTEIAAENRIRCKFPHAQSTGLKWANPGDQISFFDLKKLQEMATGNVRKMHFISQQIIELEFEKPIPANLKIGDVLENLTWSPSVSINGCYFGHHRARGVLVSTSGKVSITNNTFATSGSAIVIPCDLSAYYETGAVKDVLIQGNRFTSSCLTSLYMGCEAVVSIHPELPENTSSSIKPLHHNILIKENTFESFDYPVLYALSVDNIRFEKNTLKYENSHKAFHENRYNLTFNQCTNIVVRENRIDSNFPGKNIHLIDTPKQSISLTPNNQFSLTIEK